MKNKKGIGNGFLKSGRFNTPRWRPVLLCALLAVFAGFTGCEFWLVSPRRDTSWGQVRASRTRGVAPLAVHFYTDYPEPDEGSSLVRAFHDYEYSWDFGDAESGLWGTTGLPRNQATGAMAAHVYERPGVYTARVSVRGRNGELGSESFSIEVLNPDVVFAGEHTICVNPAGDNDFSAAPPEARRISTDDLGEVTPLSLPGTRILFKRGGQWTISGQLGGWNRNSGPVLFGAYGPGTNPDELGIYSNNPFFHLVDDGQFINMNSIQDWRIEHLRFLSDDVTSISGVFSMQRLLFLRLKMEGGRQAFSWTHYNQFRQPYVIEDMAVVSCDISGAESNTMYAGSERLAILGNRIADAGTSHVLRVFQLYKGVISHNLVSGASLQATSGRHALKLHGPGYNYSSGTDSYGEQEEGTTRLRNRTEFGIISDNVFGGSGPWPVAIGTQDGLTDSRVSNLVFERNRVIADYGSPGLRPVSVGLILWTVDTTVRNNVIDGSGVDGGFTGIVITRRGPEPIPSGNHLYHNTIYKARNSEGYSLRGIQLSADARLTVVENNLVVFPDPAPRSRVDLLQDSGWHTVAANNLLVTEAVLPGGDNAEPLLRRYAPALDSGLERAPVVYSVFEDIEGRRRPRFSTVTFGAYDY